MGRSIQAKNRRHAKRMAKSRVRKAAKQAAYQARIAAGTNRKPKRSTSKSARPLQTVRIAMLVPVRIGDEVRMAMRKVHGGDPCRNVGCLRCSELARKAA